MIARGAAGSTLDAEDDTGQERSPADGLDIEQLDIKPPPSDLDSKRSKRKLVESEPEDAIKSVGVILDVRDENDVAGTDGEHEVLKQLQHVRPRGLAASDKLRDVTNSPRRTIVQKMKKEKEKVVEEEPGMSTWFTLLVASLMFLSSVDGIYWNAGCKQDQTSKPNAHTYAYDWFWPSHSNPE